VRLAGGAVAGVERDEVLDIGGDQRPSFGRRVCEDLVVGEPYQGWIGNDRDDVIALGAELLGDGVGKHLVQQQRLAHELPSQQLALAQPGLLGGFLSHIGGGDLPVDLAGISSPVVDGGVQQA